MQSHIAVVFLATSLLLLASPCAGEGPVDTGPSTNAIVITQMGGLPVDLYRRVIEYVAEQYQAPVREREVKGPVPRKSAAFASLLAPHVTEADVCHLVLTVPHGREGGQEMTLLPSGRIVILDTTVLKTGEPATAENKEKFSRRLEKESLRAIALVLGMPPCPSGRCALLAHRNDAQLDSKSRNPCPPCLVRVREKLRETGVAMPAGIDESVPPFPRMPTPSTGPAEVRRP